MSKLFSYHKYEGGLWFRVLGRGLSIQNRQKIPAMSSERNGYVKTLRIGKWSIRLLGC